MEFTMDDNRNLPKNTKTIKYVVNEHGCHLCTSHAKNRTGYPTKGFNGSSISLARYLWYLKTGYMTEQNEFLLHKCGNTGCINLEHLYIGSERDMIQTKITKGRQPRYSNLTDQEIMAIKQNTTQTSVELASRYKVSDSTIRNIWNEKVFAYLKVENYPSYCEQRKQRVKETRKQQLLESKKGRTE